VVEIDESKFTHHTKGGTDTKVWVIGFYERGTKDVRAFTLKDKSEATILALIRENVAEGADIVTDSWRGYAECKNYYNHRIYNRQKSTDENGNKLPNDNGINRVESLWSMLKRNIHTYSTIRSSTLQRFLDEACWRIKNRTFT
jgi:IS1 family transposase